MISEEQVKLLQEALKLAIQNQKEMATLIATQRRMQYFNQGSEQSFYDLMQRINQVEEMMKEIEKGK